MTVPLRVDFAGGWLDVPKFACEGAFVVNMAISPGVTPEEWPYKERAGLGGSAAWAILHSKEAVQSELDMGVGWQDPAVIRETGLCVWRSGSTPSLYYKDDGEWLRGKLALEWTGDSHDTPGLVDRDRNFERIVAAGTLAEGAARNRDIYRLASAVDISYQAQLKEGMDKLPLRRSMAVKYCGGGHGGYAMHLYASEMLRNKAVVEFNLVPVEPYWALAPQQIWKS